MLHVWLRVSVTGICLVQLKPEKVADTLILRMNIAIYSGGAVLPFIPWLATKRWPRSSWRFIHAVSAALIS